MRLRETLDKIIDKQHELNLILVRLTSTVEEHVKRSNALEKQMDLNAIKVEQDKAIVQIELDKLQTHVDMINGFAKICAWSVVVGGGMIGILVALQKLLTLLQ